VTVAEPVTRSPAIDPSVGERLLTDLQAVQGRLLALSPREAAINLGLTALVALLAVAALFVLGRLLNAGLHRLAQKGLVDGGEAHRPRVAALTWTLIRLLVIGAALAAALSVWGVDIVGWLTTGGGVAFTRVLLVGAVVVAVVEVVGRLLDRALHRAAARSRDARRAQQIRTLTPLVRGVFVGFVLVIGVMTALSEVGVQIGPLLASAGVIGLAVGFGAQTLVKDFLTGLFLVIEDIVAVGDNVRIGDSAGTVEAMTLRTIRLRNMNGTLHVFPYSEAQVIHNRTKSFSSYVFEIGVGYSADLDHALAVMERVGAEMQADPAFRDKIMGPLEVLGVDKLGDSAVVLKARFKTQPQEQWRVGRAYNKRIKQAFDAEGIEIPFPTTKVVFDAQGPAPAAPPPRRLSS
jgi:small conductance mechanosensitive channel